MSEVPLFRGIIDDDNPRYVSVWEYFEAERDAIMAAYHQSEYERELIGYDEDDWNDPEDWLGGWEEE